MAVQLFEFLEQFMIEIFLIKLTQFKKTESLRKIFISPGNFIIKFHFRNKKSILFSWPLHFRCSIVEFVFLLIKEMNWTKEILSQIAKKYNWAWTNFETIPDKKRVKKIIATYIRVWTAIIDS